jgi:hypothetical protein
MDELVFTRYLYPKNDVKQSLLIALLQKNTKEALFWGYELFYSGFEEETFDYISNIYEYFYKSENPELEAKLFANGLTIDCLIGSIIMTLCMRQYQVAHFLKEFKQKEVPVTKNPPLKFKFIVDFKESDLTIYKTTLPQENPRFYLPTVCAYQIRRNYNIFFESACDDYTDAFRNNWLYYANDSPIWADRIREYGGVRNDEKKDIDFPDDEKYEQFYDKWGLEPDEQKKELQEKCIGEGNQCSPLTLPLMEL